MAPTIVDLLRGARRGAVRAASRVPPRLGLPRPQTTTGPGRTVVGEGVTPPVHDPALDPFAEMALLIGTAFLATADAIPYMYDRGRHAYLQEYIQPSKLLLTMTARPGLQRYESTLLPSNRPARASRPRGPLDTVDTLQERLGALQLQARPPLGPRPGGPGGGGPPTDVVTPPRKVWDPPDHLLAYDWVVSRDGGGWSKHLVVDKPNEAEVLQRLELDGVGDYTVRLRVYFTANRMSEKEVRFSVREKFLVGLGDSFASGEGNPDVGGDVRDGFGAVCEAATASIATGATPPMSTDAVWLEEKAHRSLMSGQARGAMSIQDNFGETWNPDTGPGPSSFAFTKVVWASFARSGATIRGSLLAPQGGFDDFVGAGQIEECRRTADGRPIDALLISIGGNDAGFSGVLTDLVKGDSYYHLARQYGGNDPPPVKARLDKLLGVGLPADEKGGIEVDLETLRGAVDGLRLDTPVREVYINGYPTDLFFVDGPGGPRFSACGVFDTSIGGLFSVNESEAELIKERGTLLNALIERKATEFGWHYVDVAKDFAGHGYCRDDHEKMWVGATDSCKSQGDFDGVMHPNFRGHMSVGLRYGQALEQHTLGA